MRRTVLPTWNQSYLNALLIASDLVSDADQDRARRAREAAQSIKLMRQRRAMRLQNACR